MSYLDISDREPAPAPQATGHVLVRFKPDTNPQQAAAVISAVGGGTVAMASDLMSDDGPDATASTDAGGVVFDHLGVGIVYRKENKNQAAMMSALNADERVAGSRPEFYVHAIDDVSALATTHTSSWGLNAINIGGTPYSGQGIRVAVLDTGFALTHPDFAGRSIVARSFVPGETVDDVQGHGTHCAGTAIGPFTPSATSTAEPRYGVAPDADLFVGKVLANNGSGTDGWILAGIDWAVAQGCSVISMSLGRSVQIGEDPDSFYETAGQAALNNGSLIIAAAGNDSARRFNFVAPVNSPANASTIMAVAAIDDQMQVADFSCGGLNGNGGEVNICAPGVDVLSAAPFPRLYRRLSGTSMATPHVSGVAALLAESNPNLRGQALWNALVAGARNIGLSTQDGGAGLVQVPSASAAETS